MTPNYFYCVFIILGIDIDNITATNLIVAINVILPVNCMGV